MDFRLDEEQELIVSMIRKFADKDLRAWSADADRAGTAPAKLFSLGAELGFFVDAVPESNGGLLDGSYSHLSRALRGLELGRGCAGLSALLECNVEASLAISRWGRPKLAQAVQAELVEGSLISIAHDFEGRLKFEAGSFSGTLGPIPGAARSRRLLILAEGEDARPMVALLPRSLAKVVEMTPSGWRAGAWATWSFDAVELKPECVLISGDGADEAQQEILSWARVSLAARAIGVAAAAMKNAEAYGQERVQFGQAIGEFESIIRLRDANETAIEAGRLLTLEAAQLIDRGDARAADMASRARDLAAQIVARATIDAVQIYGGYGFVNDYPVEKLMRDARAFEVLLGNESFARVLRRKARA